MIKYFTEGKVYNPDIRSNLKITRDVFITRLLTYGRYKGQVLMSVITPVMLAALPILMGPAIAGSPESARISFEAKTGTGNYAGFLLLGTLFFNLVSNSLWNFGYWLRREQMQGTLETLYSTPTDRIWLLTGTSLYVMVRNGLSFIFALILGSILFAIPIGAYLQPTLILAALLFVIGVFPLFGLSLIFGAAVLRFKDVNSLISVVNWVFSFLLGVFYPITVFPVILQLLSLILPLTWVNNALRAVLFEANYFVNFYVDFGVILAFAFFIPMISIWFFTRVEKSVQKREGFSSY
ncbi:MAG: ABC transporter permease [Promethearchaeota archaeon]